MDKYKLIVFDLDGTLAVSKSSLESDMSVLLSKLIDKYYVSIISGGDFPQFEKQILPYLKINPISSKNLVLCPTCASKMYVYNASWKKILSEDLSPVEKSRIIDALNMVSKEVGHKPKQIWGDIIEDRQTQISFSALGQKAPIEEKKNWDPDQKKRLVMVDKLIKIIPEFSIRVGGTTTIDINRKGIDKAYGLQKLIDYFKLEKSDILFVGDALFPGGNDYAAKEFGVECIQVEDPKDTMKVINDLLN